jgi:aspartate/tyrosine/aromatic aminotransferase
MTEAQITAILSSLKVDLGILRTTAYDSRLKEIIKSSFQMIQKEGATLDVSVLEDAQLVVMYSAWLWRKRDSGEGMPRMLRWALNNRILSEKANG